MNIQKGQHIRCIFYNNMMIDGIVENWSNEGAVLKSLDGQSQLIIPHVSKDIMMIKVIFSNENYLIESPIKKEFNQIVNEPPSDLRNKKLADLKIMLNNQEKEIIRRKLAEHRIGEVRKVNYETPGFLPKSITKQYPYK